MYFRTNQSVKVNTTENEKPHYDSWIDYLYISRE